MNTFALCQAVCVNKVLSCWEGEALQCVADGEPAVKRLHSFLLHEELCKLCYYRAVKYDFSGLNTKK